MFGHGHVEGKMCSQGSEAVEQRSSRAQGEPPPITY